MVAKLRPRTAYDLMAALSLFAVHRAGRHFLRNRDELDRQHADQEQLDSLC